MSNGWHICLLNSLAPAKFEWNFRYVILKRILVIDGWGIPCEIALIWMSLDFTDDQSTLVQVMAWCRQATSHYLSQCWPRSLLPNGVTRPNELPHLPWTKWPSFHRQHFPMHFHECFDWKFTDVCSKGPIDNKSALIQVMAWRRTGVKPLPEPMLAQFTDVYMRH